MPTQRPFITVGHVQAALDTLLYSTAGPVPNPLENLLLVEELLTTPDMPPTAHAREIGLHRVLIQLIEQELDKHRRAAMIPMSPLPATVAQAVHNLGMDSDARGIELIAWSYLYHRYVCVHLNLSPESLSDAFHVDQRTLRRYHRHAVRRLTERLVFAEWYARRRLRKERLTALLPVPVPVPLFGREQELRLLADYVDESTPRHVLVTGVSGVGKTTVVQEFVRQQIDEDRLDHLVWLHNPANAVEARDFIAEAVLPGQPGIGLREYLLLSAVAIVIDEASLLLSVPDEASALLADLAPALVILTCPTYTPLSSPHLHLRLSEIARADAVALVRNLVGPEFQGEARALDDLAEFLWASVGGNPMALILLARNTELLADTSDQDRASITGQVYSHVYSALDDRLKQAWLAFCLMPPGAVSVNTVASLWPSLGDAGLITQLLQRHLLERVSVEHGTSVLTTAGRQFLELEYTRDPGTRALVDRLVESLDDRLEMRVPEARLAARFLLRSGWIELDSERRARWQRILWEDPAAREHAAEWRVILERDMASSDDLQAQLAYGVCLRRLAQLDEAEQVLRAVMEQAGHSGEFVVQARACVELSIALRYRGHYEKSLRLLDRAAHVARRYRDDDLREAAARELAHVALDRGQPEQAERVLTGLKPSRYVQVLRAEAALLRGALEPAREYVDHALALVHPSDLVARAALSTMLARLHEQQGTPAAARDYYSSAVTLLEQTDDRIALARARGNLGAILLASGEDSAAFDVLTLARRDQALIGDVTALAATEHNLRALREKAAADR